MRGLPSLNALRAFEAAARLGRMTLAASELCVTHGAISRQIKTLEAQLGCRLLDGPRNHLTLTEAGHKLLPALTSGFECIERGVREVSDSGSGILDVSCLGTLTMRWLIPRIHRFSSKKSLVEVRLSADDGPVDFRRHRCDVAIRVGQDDWPNEAQVTTLFPEVVGPVMSPQMLRGREHVSMGRLRRLPKLHTKTRRYAWADWCARANADGVQLTGQTFEHFYFALEAATAGLGVAIAPWPLVIDDVRAGRLLAPFGFIDSGQRYVALCRTGRNKHAEEFVSWLATEGKTLPVPGGS